MGIVLPLCRGDSCKLRPLTILRDRKAKNRCIKERICSSDILMGSYPCEFTAYDLKECEEIKPALAGYKTANRHLETQIKTCELRKAKSRYGKTVYQWIRE